MANIRDTSCGRIIRFAENANVLGAFSSNGGEDFKAVLESICSIKENNANVPRPAKWTNAGEIVADNYSVAWRVLDAQYWGVPQRRKRIFLVADLAGRCAGKILFEFAHYPPAAENAGVSGYSAESFRSWQGAAQNAERCAGTSSVCLNDQGGQRIEVSDDVTATLRAETHGHPPAVMQSAGFCTEHSAKARSIGYEKETSPTLRAGTVPAAVYENHSQDTRYTELSDVAPTVSSTYGTGGNNQPFVVENTECFDVRFTPEGTKNARQNCYKTETARTIDTGGNAPDSNQGGVAVVYGICSKESNSMKSGNPNSGFYKADTARTLDGNGGDPSCNQGGRNIRYADNAAVVESYGIQGSMIGRENKNGPMGSGVSEDVSFTLNTTDRHAVAFTQDTYSKYSENDKGGALRAKGGMYALSRFAGKRCGGSETLVYSTSKNSHHTQADENIANTLVASDYKDPPTVTAEPFYIVRRLTPTECARLQGFPDRWCAELANDEPTEEDMKFWRTVFDTYARIMRSAQNAVNGTKPRSDSQIRKWLKEPHSDSAEYTMWGNGVALPCVYFVLAGIVWANEKEKTG